MLSEIRRCLICWAASLNRPVSFNWSEYIMKVEMRSVMQCVYMPERTHRSALSVTPYAVVTAMWKRRDSMKRQCIALNWLTIMLLKSHRICMGLRKHMQVEQCCEWTGQSLCLSECILYSRHVIQVTLKRPDVTEMYIRVHERCMCDME
jgi:hypothetical protein